MLRSISLRAKLISAFLVFSAFLAIVGGVGFFSLSFMRAKYHKVAVDILPKTFATAEIRAVVQTASREVAHMSNSQFPKEERAGACKRLGERIKRFDAAVERLASYNLTAGELEFVQETRTDWNELQPMLEQAIKLAQAGTPESDLKLEKLASVDIYKTMFKFNDLAAHIRKTLDNETEAEVAATEASAKTTYAINLVAVTSGLVLSIVFAFIFGTAISRKLQLVSGAFAESVNHINEQAYDVAGSGEQLSAAVTEQAATLQTTASSIEEIREMVSVNADGARRSNELAIQGKQGAEASMKSVERMLQAMENISASNSRGFDGLKETVHQLGTVVKVIADIGQKTHVINDIVFQTKLLSFNASVEAARAGENGRGFAVVAEEVGNLAAMSGQASREISEMLGAGITSVNSVVTNTRKQIDDIIRESESTVDQGTVAARECRDTLGHLTLNVAELQIAVDQIANANGVQAHRVVEITRSIQELDGVTTLNRQLADRAATSSLLLKDRSAKLSESLEELDQTVNGRAS